MPSCQRHTFLLLILACLLGACATNPVTGKRELHLVSEAQEIRIGEENYLSSQQMQGGTYALDADLGRYVNEVGQRLVKVSDRPGLPYEFVVLNNGVPNAWALPGGKIAINRGLLLHLHTEAELAAVLGHEIVHAAARHGAKAMERGMLMQAGVAVVGVAAADTPYSQLIVGGAAVGAQLVTMRYGRDAELESDERGIRYMVAAGYDPMAAVRLQETFVKLSEGRQSNWLEGLFASHPPSQERVEANRRLAARHAGQNLRTGEREYQQHIASISNSRAAYEKYEQGRGDLVNKDYQGALRHAREAIAMEPREAQFHGLRGEVYIAQQNWQAARAEFDQAIQRNGNYFAFHLLRGYARHSLGETKGAQADLEQSVKLLPTALGHYLLGNIAEQSGARVQALEHYKVAASSKSPVGQEAGRALVRMDLKENPQNYLTAQAALDGAGRLVVQVANRSELPVQNVVLEVKTLADHEFVINEVIDAGASIQVRPPITDAGRVSSVRVKSAEIFAP